MQPLAKAHTARGSGSTKTIADASGGALDPRGKLVDRKFSGAENVPQRRFYRLLQHFARAARGI